MTINVPDVGENLILEMIVNKTAAQNLSLRLYKSNTTPADTDTAGTYTEADFGGYAAITLTGATWSAAASGSIAYSAQQTFTLSSGSNSIYGYYITQAVSGVILLSERDPSAPFSMANVGDNVKITPTITAS